MSTRTNDEMVGHSRYLVTGRWTTESISKIKKVLTKLMLLNSMLSAPSPPREVKFPYFDLENCLLRNNIRVSDSSLIQGRPSTQGYK